MGTPTTIEKQKALAWLSKRLKWERTLAELRLGRPAPARKAA
jgi:hypothetical protein